MSSTQQLLLTEGGGAAPNYIEDVFSTYLYTGTGASQTITNNIDLSTKGGMTWIKSRSAATNHNLFDTAQGATKLLHSNTTGATVTDANSLTAFNTTGFTLGSGNTAGNQVNTSSATYASWTFRKQSKFFDVVTYTGNGAVQTLNHNLGSVPGCMIVKKTSAVDDWYVYHRSTGATKAGILNSTGTFDAFSVYWNNTAPTSTQFTIGTNESTNGETYVVYLFAHDAGGFGLTGTDNVISCGSYTGTGAAGNTISLGYEPQFLLIKNASNAAGWYMYDDMRGFFAPTKSASDLSPNTSAAEAVNSSGIYKNATGFSINTTGSYANASGDIYIYIAIRRGPMKVPTDATKVFIPIAVTNTTGAVNTTNFPVDLQMLKDGRSGVSGIYAIDRLRGVSTTPTEVNNPYLQTSSTGAESSFTVTKAWNNTGFQTSSSFTGASEVYWNFQRAPSFFDEVCYTGTGTSGLTVTHNLKTVPELMIVKSRSPSAGNWQVYNAAKTATDVMYLNTTNASFADSGAWANTAPTSSVFSVGANGDCNDNNGKYVAYLFATCAGVSKVGSYTGTGTTKQIDCGFAAGARFVLIKRTDSTGDWYVWDTARGMVSGTDPSLLLNSTAAEVNANSIYTTTGGFQIVSTAAGINASGGSYIYFSVA